MKILLYIIISLTLTCIWFNSCSTLSNVKPINIVQAEFIKMTFIRTDTLTRRGVEDLYLYIWSDDRHSVYYGVYSKEEYNISTGTVIQALIRK